MLAEVSAILVAVAALPAPPVFVSGAHALTFQSPADAMICPLPPGWVGSDHGTVLFLEAPQACGGAGFPSSARNWNDERLTRRIEVYYQYWLGEDEPRPPRCHERGTVFLMGRRRKLCSTPVGPGLRLWARARYMADTDSWVEIALVTRRETLSRDLTTFRTWAGAVRPCRVHWSTDNGHSGVYGPAPDCPKSGTFF